jgi:2'-hydroxyisoflavone reductase
MAIMLTKWNKMRILVLGGTNFIGRAIVTELLSVHEITVLNRGKNQIWGERVVQLTADRSDAGSVRAVLDGVYDAVVDVSATEPKYIETTAPLLREAGVPLYVFISSGSVYNSATTHIPFREDAPISGDAVWGPYGQAKADCEELLVSYGFPGLTMLRPPYIYGPRNNEPRESFLWARMLTGKPIFIPGDGSARIQFAPVDYVAAVVAQACERKLAPGTYNIGEPRDYSFDEYIDTLRVACGDVPSPVYHVQDTQIAAREYFPFRNYSMVLDTKALMRAAETAPEPLLGGLRNTFQWFSENGDLTYAATEREQEFIKNL